MTPQDVEAQEIENQDLLSPSSSSPAIWPITESIATPGDVASGSVSLDERVKNSVDVFWRFRSKWINDAVKEVRFSLPSGNL